MSDINGLEIFEFVICLGFIVCVGLNCFYRGWVFLVKYVLFNEVDFG